MACFWQFIIPLDMVMKLGRFSSEKRLREDEAVVKFTECTIYEFLNAIANRFGDKEALLRRTGNQWNGLTYRELKQKSETLACSLASQGIRRGDKVLLMAQSCPEYAVGFFGLALAGAVTVPVDVKLSAQDQAYLAQFSEAVAILCPDEMSRKVAAALTEKVPALQSRILMVNELSSPSLPIDILPESLGIHDLALITFTSGTTSNPKGVMLTWHHFMFQVEACVESFPHRGNRRMLSLLPLHHMFEFSAGLLNPLATGAQVYYANSIMPQQILGFMRNEGITSMLTVPLFLRALKKGIEAEVNTSAVKKFVFGGMMMLSKYIPVRTLRRILFSSVLKKLGPNMKQFICGASKLDASVAEFFQRLGIFVHEGYGLTETSPIVSTNTQHSRRNDTVGKPLKGVEVKLDSITGEILVKGPNVMLGYFNNPVATRECLSADGWFNTGDLGKIDAEGFVKIIGRNKDLIVLGSGKKVVPEEVEFHFKDLDFVQDICVVGTHEKSGPNKGHEVVNAVVIVSPSETGNASLEERLEEYRSTLQVMAQSLSYYKRPTNFIIQERPLPKTSTLKTKRFLVKELLQKKEATT